jgi:hypothetical protein
VGIGSGGAKTLDVLEYDVTLLRGSAVTTPSDVEVLLDSSAFDKETTTVCRNVRSRRPSDVAPCPVRTKTCAWEQAVVQRDSKRWTQISYVYIS